VAPDAIKRVLAEAPGWLEVRQSPEVDAMLQQLDSGEREVIALALLIGADSVLLDERKGRYAARERGLRVSGTLGVIRLAADQGLIELADALDRLEKTNFRATPKLLNIFRGGVP
jgi:hypothetical protein